MAKACPCCGFLPVRKPDIIIPAEGDLALVVNGKPSVAQIDMQQFFDEVAGLAQERGRKPGYAYHKVKEKFGHSPPSWMKANPRPPSPEVRSWCRSRDIAYWKAMERSQ